MTRQRLVGIALAVATVILVAVNQHDIGIARDEVVYMQNGAHYAEWWLGLVTFEHGPGEASVTKTFGGPNATDNNREHPPAMKTLFGLSEHFLHRKLGLLDEITAYRLPSAILHGILVALVYFMVLELWGFAEAIVAALLLVLLPRALFHAGLAAFDAPTMALWFATVYAYWRGLDGRRWPWQAGVVWGLALVTKHTAFLLPFALAVHYVVVAVRAHGWNVPAIVKHRWRVIVSLVVLGPLTLYVVWPWLWYAPIQHVKEWIGFHTSHVHYNYEYLGHNWNAPRFPWHVALVTTLFTVPVATLASAAIGATTWLIAPRPRDPRAPALLLVLSAAASIGPFLLGSTPIFGAEKHWMPVLPTICIAAGVGAVWAAREAVAYLARWRRIPINAAIGVVCGCVVAAAAVETITAQPYALTSYTALAGGAPGGADLGMNRQFWGVAARGILARVAAEAPATGTAPVYTHDASPAWGLYIKDGLIPKSMPDAGWEQQGIERSQLAFVVHELHFNRHDYMIWKAYGTVQPIFVLRSDGVPIVSLYKRRSR